MDVASKKVVSVLLPTFNEEGNVVPMANAVREQFAARLPEYDYEIVFIDNCSTDRTREKIQDICGEDRRVKAIFNSRNFGQFNSPYYGLCQTTGDCSVLMCSDFQEPPEMIPRFVKEWEKGFKIVVAIKSSSRENSLMYFLRSCYYAAIKKFSQVEQIEHFTGFGLYDRAVRDEMRKLDDATPFMRGIVAELGFSRCEIPYEQQKRREGKTKNNWATLYDAAMLGFTAYTKAGLRSATILGFLFSGVSLCIAIVYLILKLLYWESFPMGTAPILIGVFVLGSVQLFFIGFLGEYIMGMNVRLMKRPLVVEEKRINFEDSPGEER